MGSNKNFRIKGRVDCVVGNVFLEDRVVSCKLSVFYVGFL